MFQLFLWDIMFLLFSLLCIMFYTFLAFVILVDSHVFIMFHMFLVFVIPRVSTHMFLSCFYHVLYIPNFCYYYSFGTHVSIIFLSCFFHVLYILNFCYSCSFGTYFSIFLCHVSTRKMFWVFRTWYEGLCRSGMKYRNNSCQRAWIGHMACKKKCKQKMAWSHIRPKGQWGYHHYMLQTPCVTQVGNIVVFPIIMF
jgi:hypothetical protein